MVGYHRYKLGELFFVIVVSITFHLGSGLFSCVFIALVFYI